MSSRVHFKPWIGKHYHAGIAPGRKLLLLGESHYSSHPEKSDFTIELTREYVNHEWSHGFWTNIMQCVDGRPHAEIDRAEFWSRVALYNYVQEIVGESRGVAPSASMFERGIEPFFEVLRSLQPTHVLVLCKRLWENLPNQGSPESDFEAGGLRRERWTYPTIPGKSAVATWIPHPSYGFSPKKWPPVIVSFLQEP